MICRVFVVETKLAADTRHAESFEVIGDSSDGFLERPVDLRIPWVSKLEVIGYRDRFCAGGDQVAECFRDDSHCSPVGVDVALFAVAICCESKETSVGEA